MRKLSSVVLLVVAFVAVVATGVVLASDGALPWDDLEIPVGNVLLAWAGIQTAVVQMLKSIKVSGRPLLATKWQKRLANVALGFVGLVLASSLTGTPILQALSSAILATLGAVGVWEYLGDGLGKSQSASDSPNVQTST